MDKPRVGFPAKLKTMDDRRQWYHASWFQFAPQLSELPQCVHGRRDLVPILGAVELADYDGSIDANHLEQREAKCGASAINRSP